MAGIGWATRTLMALALGVVANAAGAADCGALCGVWQLDAAASDPVDVKVDAVLAEYRDARPRDGSPPDPDSLEASIGPIIDRPDRGELRTQILRALAPPQRLSIAADGADVLVGADSRPPRRLSPGVPHSRVDSEGTARIRCSLESGKLTVSESYDRRRGNSEIYAVQRRDGTLVVTREFRRPGLKTLLLRSVYRPS